MKASKCDSHKEPSNLIAAVVLAAAVALSGCSSSSKNEGGGGTSGTGGTAGSGGTAGTGGTGGEEPPPPPESTGVVLDSGGATIRSDQYEMEVSVGGPIGKGKAHSAQYMLDYFIPTRPER